MKKIPINPRLRKGFDNTPNDQRSESEIKRWWGRPYIRTSTYEEHQTDATHEDHVRRMAGTGYDPWSKEEFEEKEATWRKNWFEAWPDGTRYEVRCLDGGAWDRSTLWGMFPTLDEALICAGKSVPDYLAVVKARLD
ncbi:MAG: hypothetical protein ACXWT0_00135 [Methylobacter sp.]